MYNEVPTRSRDPDRSVGAESQEQMNPENGAFQKYSVPHASVVAGGLIAAAVLFGIPSLREIEFLKPLE